MKNRINFFRDDLKPKIVLLNLNFVLFMATFCILIILAGWVWANTLYTNTENKIDGLLAEVEQTKFQVDTFREAKDSRTQNMSIIASIEKNQQELDMKLTILDELNNRETQRSNGFSALMADLAQYHQPSLWLTTISLDERKLYMEGTTANSEALPKWVSKLGQANYFSGREFAGARMMRNDKDTLNFILSSELDDVKGDGE